MEVEYAVDVCRMNSYSNVSYRTGCHAMIQYYKDNGTIALAKESKISSKVQTHRVAVNMTTSCRDVKSRLRG